MSIQTGKYRKKFVIPVIFLSLMALSFASQSTAQTSPALQDATPGPEMLLITANDAAAILGWPKEAQLYEFTENQKYALVRSSESIGNCTYYYTIVVGKGEIRRSPTSTIDFHGYIAQRR